MDEGKDLKGSKHRRAEASPDLFVLIVYSAELAGWDT